MNARHPLASETSKTAPNPADTRNDAVAHVLTQVSDRLPSRIADHGAECCRAARAWFRTMAVAAAAHHPGPPAWIRRRWEWGPNEWPLHWCRIPLLESLDCGALASVARAALEHNGSAALQVQLLERFNPSASENWRASWKQAPHTNRWTWGPIAYHEAVAIRDGAKLAVWDPTDGHFIERDCVRGYGSIIAIRFSAPLPNIHEVVPETGHFWEGRAVSWNRWVRLDIEEANAPAVEAPSRKSEVWV